MREELISFETSILAKEKGFDVPCKLYYGKTGIKHSSKQRITHKSLISGFLLPTQSLLQRWLREKHNLHLIMETYVNNNKVDFTVTVCYPKNNVMSGTCYESSDTYEKTLEVGLRNALKLINI